MDLNKKIHGEATVQELGSYTGDKLNSMHPCIEELYRRGLMGSKSAIKAIDQYNEAKKGIQQQNTIVSH